MPEFTNYTNINLRALNLSSKFNEIISKKQAILDGVFEYYNFVPSTILFVGFNPAILSTKGAEVFVTEISDEARAFLDANQISYTYVPAIPTVKTYDVIVAVDEYFTYAASSQDQVDKINKLCNATKEFVISTIRDYKNQEYKDRECSVPAIVRRHMDCTTFSEFNNWYLDNRHQWDSKVYEIDIRQDSLKVHGPFKRHTMYFKQLAKFSIDCGAENFMVHRNLMYKSPIKRNYEHVVSIKFENYDNTNN